MCAKKWERIVSVGWLKKSELNQIGNFLRRIFTSV